MQASINIPRRVLAAKINPSDLMKSRKFAVCAQIFLYYVYFYAIHFTKKNLCTKSHVRKYQHIRVWHSADAHHKKKTFFIHFYARIYFISTLIGFFFIFLIYSTESGWDNPFRPGGDLSREADEIVNMIKGMVCEQIFAAALTQT